MNARAIGSHQRRQRLRFVVAFRLLLWLWGSELFMPGAIRPLGAQQSRPALALRDVTVIDVTNGRLHPGQTVVIVGNHVRAVGPTNKVRVPAGARVVGASGKYLIPGLWEMHIHINSESQLAYNVLIANGVTGMREMGTGLPLAEQRRERDEILAGTRIGPRMLVTGGWVQVKPLSDLDRDPINEIRIATPDDGRRVADSLKRAGADHIKLIVSDEFFRAAAAEARRIGLRIAGHLPDGLTPEEAADNGMRMIEHTPLQGACFTSWRVIVLPAGAQKCLALAAHLRRRGTWIGLDGGQPPLRVTSDTLRARMRYWPRRLWEDTADFARIDHIPDELRLPKDFAVPLQRSGVPVIVTGHSDSPTRGVLLPGFKLHDALALWVELGLTPLNALQAVTLNPAKYLDGTDSLGTVAPGKLADLVLLDANPLDDIYNTQKIRAVIANGRFFDRAALDELLVQTGKTE